MRIRITTGTTSPRGAQARPKSVKTAGGGSSSSLPARVPISNRNTARIGSPMCLILKARKSPNPGKLRNTRAGERLDPGPKAAMSKWQHCQEWVVDLPDSKGRKIAESKRNIKMPGGSMIKSIGLNPLISKSQHRQEWVADVPDSKGRKIAESRQIAKCERRKLV